MVMIKKLRNYHPVNLTLGIIKKLRNYHSVDFLQKIKNCLNVFKHAFFIVIVFSYFVVLLFGVVFVVFVFVFLPVALSTYNTAVMFRKHVF